MKVNPVGWFEIYVQDMKRAKAFYEAVLQHKLAPLEVDESEIWSFPMDMESSGASGALVKMDGVEPGGTGTMVYFNCADCSVEASRVVEAGGQLMQGKTSIGEFGFMAMALDTEGNKIGLHSNQ